MDREAVLADLKKWLGLLGDTPVHPKSVIATIEVLEEWYE